jgi:DNA-binding XRE family transcriptional regulator
MDGVTYVKDEAGKDIAAVVPIRRWRKMLAADREDRALAKRARAVDRKLRIPIEFARRDLNGENRVRVYRSMRGLTQAALAAKIGSQTAYISQIETGKRGGGKATLRRIAVALNLPLSVLLD